MKKKYLIVIDMQNDFVSGALGSSEAAAIVPKVYDRIMHFDGEVIFTQDTHLPSYSSTQEGQLLPVIHCVENTEGWHIVPLLSKIQQEKQHKVFRKNVFGSLELANELKIADEKGEVESVELIGLCTDVCVVNNALLLKTFLPEVPVIVDASCCAGITPEKHAMALSTMESCHIIIHNKPEADK